MTGDKFYDGVSPHEPGPQPGPQAEFGLPLAVLAAVVFALVWCARALYACIQGAIR